jgi:hypothetical protein
MAEKEVIIEFSKMALDHNDSLMKISGGLMLANIVLIANLKSTPGLLWRVNTVSVLLLTSTIAALLSFGSGYLANSVIVAQMADYAAKGTWTTKGVGEVFTLFQIIGLVGGILIFAVTLFFFRSVTMDAVRKSGLGGGAP